MDLAHTPKLHSQYWYFICEQRFYNYCDGFSITRITAGYPIIKYISDKKQITYILTQNGIAIPVHFNFFRVQFCYAEKPLMYLLIHNFSALVQITGLTSTGKLILVFMILTDFIDSIPISQTWHIQLRKLVNYQNILSLITHELYLGHPELSGSWVSPVSILRQYLKCVIYIQCSQKEMLHKSLQITFLQS